MERMTSTKSAINKEGDRGVNDIFQELVAADLWDVEVNGNQVILEAREASDAITTEEIVVGLEGQERTDEESTTEKEIMDAARPERENSPQIAWPESNSDGTISEESMRRRYDFWLTNMGFVLDAARLHIDSSGAAEQWLEYKRAVYEAKSITDPYKKSDAFGYLNEVVYEFATSQGVTQADFDKVMND